MKITGHGLRGLKSSWRTLDAENSGTTIRLLSGILSGQEFTTKITGDSSLQKRPMKRVVTPLRQMGAGYSGQGRKFSAVGNSRQQVALQFITKCPCPARR